ncbi:uncharacterized protein LOC107464532 [Arachis duranensis]|uniref:Uncharacterized protein LOC107464532 n=1 Tax=Arachis duranensis TaxID=130453 RepID=A0A6P4BA60_ARADU|nr:uncharacterized protein LOC107464532 [Arachis duranensis]XP_025618083.1 uncharacterized protein LOC112710175 [Arachis hypogaea]QHO33568.1 TMV resistance protein N [Arachis hypogaea]
METEVIFLCSYGGQIKFHDGTNQHMYEGGKNKKLRVRSSINFNDLIAELADNSGTADVAYFEYQIPGYGLETLVSVTNDRDLRNLMREFDPNIPDDVKRIFLFPEKNPSPSPPPPQRLERVDSPLQVAENASELEAVAGPRVNHVVHYLMLVSAGLLFTAVLLFLVPFVFTLQPQNHSVMVVNDDLKSTGTIAPLGSDDLDDQSVSDKAAAVPAFDPSNAADFYVFISFRGKDSRINFVCHLHQALNQQQIKVFIDHKLPKGHSIWPSLLKAIESSHLSLVIFSQDYASSKWCLQELVKILETMKQQGQVVLPVFYNIDPSHVRYQLGSFKQAFEKHVQKFDPIVVQNWKTALTEAADLIGWDSKSPYIRDDDDLVQQIVEDVLEKKNQYCKSKA